MQKHRCFNTSEPGLAFPLTQFFFLKVKRDLAPAQSLVPARVPGMCVNNFDSGNAGMGPLL